jgi:coenzyme F420 hydrogenase subunit beta
MPFFKPRTPIQNPQQVAANRLCLGCGACFAVCPENKVRLVDVEDDGIRPFLTATDECGSCDLCLRACPGIAASLAAQNCASFPQGQGSEIRWGSFIEVWEGFASDAEIRLKGSSGGLCTALSLFCIDQGISGGVLHIGSDPEKPWKNKTFRSTSREELVRRTGSRYSPASPCEGFLEIERAIDKSVFIGKPCDVAGLRLAQTLRPELTAKTALSIGFFCAGTPSTKGTLELLRTRGVDPYDVSAFRYRGMGWPGMAAAEFKDPKRPTFKMTYNESWGFVQKYRPFRCYLCPDLTAEFADISVGDPWYREIGEHEAGRSLILIRTQKGREIFRGAMQRGYVTAERAAAEVIDRSQVNLLGKRREIWGRLLAMRLLGIPYPKLEGFHLFENWMQLPPKTKIKSILGTVRRIIQRNYFKPIAY